MKELNMKIRKTIILSIVFIFGLLNTVYTQDFYDMYTIQTIEISFSESNWDQLLDNAYSTTGDYIMADSVIINGVSFDSVGVKYKGNSSYSSYRVKNPWHIELDTYKDQEYQGYSDIKLANGYNDPSFLRDVLGYQIIRQYMDAPEANFANLYVNGTLIGLYSNTEAISKTFVKDRFGSKSNAFFNCSPPDGASPQGGDYPNLVYLGQDSSDYYDAYEMKSDEGWQELINLCDTLENNIDDIEKILDIDKSLWMLAFDNAIVNLDSYLGIFSQNYYLYRDDYGRFLPVVWDLNESFGVFSQTGSTSLSSTSSKQQMSYLLHSGDSNWPLISNLLDIPQYKRMYIAHMKTILLENFDDNSYYTTGQSLQTLISSSVQADDNKFFTYNQFISNLTSDVSTSNDPRSSSTSPGITNLMDGRSDYLLNLTSFSYTEPEISDISLSDSNPVINQTIYFSASVSDATNVYLKYRTESGAPFSEKQMYDDGLHEDGSANDGIYGVESDELTSLTQYYFYAENSNAGKFSPERAAYEFYSLAASLTSDSNGDLVINEFLASNETTVSDQDDEYNDWIELYNNGSSSVDVSGYFLSDDESDIMKWEIPSETIIEANGYLIIWADDDEDQSGLHAGFKLSASGEWVILSDPSGNVIDNINYTEQTTDISYGRYPNGTGSFQTMYPSYNSENTGSTGLSESIDKIFELSLYPNPAHETITVSADVIINTINIYNLSGQLIKSVCRNDKTVEIDLHNMESSIYLIQVYTEDGQVQMKKIIRN